MIEYVLIDDFFENVDEIRKYALSMKYVASDDTTGWKGYRKQISDNSIHQYIKTKLISMDNAFLNIDLKMFFHYSTSDTKNTIKNFDEYRLHKDDTEWAGVVYLSPIPMSESGTTLHKDDGELVHNIENKYNRFIFYKGNILHGVLNTFGDTIDNARLTLTIFGTNDKKNRSLI